MEGAFLFQQKALPFPAAQLTSAFHTRARIVSFLLTSRVTMRDQICIGLQSSELVHPSELRKTCFYCSSFSIMSCFIPREQYTACRGAAENRFVTWLAGLQSPPRAAAGGLLSFCMCF